MRDEPRLPHHELQVSQMDTDIFRKIFTLFYLKANMQRLGDGLYLEANTEFGIIVVFLDKRPVGFLFLHRQQTLQQQKVMIYTLNAA